MLQRTAQKESRKAVFRPGDIRETDKQRKKHASQMSEEEKHYLSERLLKIPYHQVYVSEHLQKKDIGYDREDIIKTLQKLHIKELIVEYNETPKEHYTDLRVLVRSDDEKVVSFHKNDGTQFQAPANLCFVISLLTGKLVTAYWNIANDSHKTMRWERYDESLEIIKNRKKVTDKLGTPAKSSSSPKLPC